MTFSYISHKLDQFLKNCSGTAIEIVKKFIFEIDSKFTLNQFEWFIFIFSESSRSELQNATNQTSLSFLVQKFWFFKNIKKNKPNFYFSYIFVKNGIKWSQKCLNIKIQGWKWKNPNLYATLWNICDFKHFLMIF